MFEEYTGLELDNYIREKCTNREKRRYNSIVLPQQLMCNISNDVLKECKKIFVKKILDNKHKKINKNFRNYLQRKKNKKDNITKKIYLLLLFNYSEKYKLCDDLVEKIFLMSNLK